MRILRVLLLTLCLAGAAHAGPGQELNDRELKSALKLYRTKCARCHKFYDPAKYDEATWQDWFARMSRKSKLKPEQNRLLAEYLSYFRDPKIVAERKLIRPK